MSRAQTRLQEQGNQGVRVLKGILSLAGKRPVRHIKEACEWARAPGALRPKALQGLMPSRAQQAQFGCVRARPMVRPWLDTDARAPPLASDQAPPAVWPPAQALIGERRSLRRATPRAGQIHLCRENPISADGAGLPRRRPERTQPRRDLGHSRSPLVPRREPSRSRDFTPDA